MSTRRKHSAYASAVARHISSEGCQFEVVRDDIAEGQRFSFALDGYPPIRGTVRWVVSDRVGFAFDRPISRDAQSAMRKRCAIVEGVELYLS
ncbi:PilZ domain-containing protein [Novosphingobium sp. 18050]|uniref:PilZ domain-containing protein n=1 Tax=Novosphingobium sp. 18050 TaxID=2681398 RepID=UPI0013596A25|nr:PilZ domain-containing protein [Novosphingobium sp. 18050]